MAAGNHDGAGPEVQLLVYAELMNFGTIKFVRDQGVFGVGDDVIALLRSRHASSERRECAETCECHKDAGHDYEYAN